LGNYNGTPSKIVTALQGIKDKLGSNTEVVYEKAIQFTNDTLLGFSDMSSQYSIDGKKGFKAEYFNNKELTGAPFLTRAWKMTSIISGRKVKRLPINESNRFFCTYTTDFTAGTTGDVTFEMDADDGYKLMIDGKEVIDAWLRNRFGARTYKLKTEKGKTYRIVVEYYQGEGKANVRLRAGNFIRSDFAALPNRIKDADALLFMLAVSHRNWKEKKCA
jgi:beta-glucosidase